MARLLALLIALIPLAIAPGLFFYFDVTPKTALLLPGTAAVSVWWSISRGTSALHRASRPARWFSLIIAGMAGSLVVSTVASVNPALSFTGSNWRNWGLVTQVAALAFAYFVASCCATRPDSLRWVLRGIAASGLVTAVYGAVQYFGWDPLLDPKGYHAGEGIFTIVRPPATLGHADYFGTWLLAVVFCGAALLHLEESRFWQRLAWASIVLGTIAIVLSGTRAAMLGLLAGSVLLVFWRGLRLTRRTTIAAGTLVLASVLFYWSPAGAKLRARLYWALHEPAGGARFLLWRDSLRMASARWPAGYGPETYIATFARWQSPDLARAFPDFYHESPHNIFLDVLVAQGLPGAILLAALCGVGLAAAWQLHGRHRKSVKRDTAGALAAGLAAMIIGEQFASFMLPTALPFYVLIAALVGLTCEVPLEPRTAARRWPAAAAGVSFAAVLSIFAVRLLAQEDALASVRRDLDANLVAEAAASYARFEDWRLPGASADLWYSRRLAQIADSQAPLAARVQAVQEGRLAAQHATQTAEDPFNAYYNLAEFCARQNDFEATERSLRSAIETAPNWFKPHWMLAQVLQLASRLKDAEGEAARAVALDGGKHPEINRTLENLRNELGTANLQPPHK